jgi:hypothetical protein
MLPPSNSHGNRPPVEWNLPEARCTACSGLTKILKTKEKSAGLAGLKKKVQFL